MFADAATPSMVSIERAVLDLEAAETRKDTLTAMGDVYTATASKSMLAKSKYKKVMSNNFDSCCNNFSSFRE